MSDSLSASSYFLPEDLDYTPRLAINTCDNGSGETKGFMGSPRSRQSFRVSRKRIDSDTKYSAADSVKKFEETADRLVLRPNYTEILQNPSKNPFQSLPFDAFLPVEFYQFMLKQYQEKEKDKEGDQGGEADDAKLKLLSSDAQMSEEGLKDVKPVNSEEFGDENTLDDNEYKKALLREINHEKEQCIFLNKRITTVSCVEKVAPTDQEKQRLNKIKLKASITYLTYFQNDMIHLKAYLDSLEESLREFFPRHDLKNGVRKKIDYDPEDFDHHSSPFEVLKNFKVKKANLSLSQRRQKNQLLFRRRQKNELLKYYIELCETHHTLNYVYRLLSFHKGRAIDYQNVFMQLDFNDPTQAVAYRYSRTLRCKVDGPSEAFLLRAFRRNHFPLLNVIRLTFLVRFENVIDKFALLIGSPISQQVYIHMVDAFSWTQFLGWLFYLPRIITNISIAIHNARRSSAFNQKGLTLWKKIQRFFSMLWHNTSERKWQQFNDFAWAVIGLCTCFIPHASLLTPLLYLYDIFVAIYQHHLTVHMWDSRRRYAASLCENYQQGSLSENDALAAIHSNPLLFNPFQKREKSKFGSHESVRGVIDLVDNKEAPISGDRVGFYSTHLNLIRLYQYMCDQVLSVNDDTYVRDCSVWSVPELHRRAIATWTFHVSGIIALIDDEKVQKQIRGVYRTVKAFSFALPFHVKKEMKARLEKNSQHFSGLDLRKVAESHPVLRRYFSAMKKGYRKAKTALIRDAIVTTCLALGMIGGFIGSGASIFGLISMPSIPLLAVISLGTVFLTSLSSLIMNRTGTPTIRIKGA